MASIAVDSTRSTRPLGLRPVHFLMIGIIVLALGYGGWSLKDSLARSVSIGEAKQASGTVQVYGFLYSPGEYDEDHNWTFHIQDEDGSVLKVVHDTKPGNFEDAIGVSAVGSYNPQTDSFEADRLMVKCPSKYQEQTQVSGS
jgi:cytochrome c-type biogenesis protein CcmE